MKNETDYAKPIGTWCPVCLAADALLDSACARTHVWILQFPIIPEGARPTTHEPRPMQPCTFSDPSDGRIAVDTAGGSVDGNDATSLDEVREVWASGSATAAAQS